MKSAQLRSFVTIIACSIGLVLTSVTVSAATTKTANPITINNNTNTLKISPVRSDVVISAGTSKQVPVEVFNNTSTTVSLKAIENDFVAGDEKGTPSVILDENSYAPTHSLKRFMVPLANIVVPANSSQIVNVTITVPKSAQAGGYFGAIRFAPAAVDGSKSVNLGASVVSLILMSVPGPTTEQLNLTNFDIQQNGGTASNFRTPSDISVLVRFQNKGNVQEAPFGQIYVRKGSKVVYTSDFNSNDPKGEVLPDSARRWTVPLKNFGKFGKYTVGATFTYSTSNRSIDISKTIWIVPSMYIIGGLIALAVLIALIVGIILFLKSYKRRVLKSSRRRY